MESSKISLISEVLSKEPVKATISSITSSNPRAKSAPQEKYSAPKSARVLYNLVEAGKHNRCEKRWFAAFFTAAAIWLLTSSFTITLIDNFLMGRGVDLFGTTDRVPEIVLNGVQFMIVFVLLMWLLKQF